MSVPYRLDGTEWGIGLRDGVLHRDGDLLFVLLPMTARMEIIWRTEEELFTDTVMNKYRSRPFTCAINGLMYSVDRAGILDAFMGDDPIPAKHTTPNGLLIQGGGVLGGRSAPLMCYVANDQVGNYKFGEGDPPVGSACAIGGVGPLLIDGLSYGVGNVCGPPVVCPPASAPDANLKPFMVQRNNKTYEAQQLKPAPVGKAVIATLKKLQRLLILVQRNGVAGLKMDDLRDRLIRMGCDNAVFLDGSDSVMLNVSGFFEARPAPDKNETNTVGVAFYL